MDVRGQRVLVFGDSLTARGSAEQVNVTEPPNRASSAPGDLLASWLLASGAQAARIDARSGRSAINFWDREATAQLLAADAAWKPTLVVVMLGTNDIGRDMVRDTFAMKKIHDAFVAMGARVIAIGPPSFTREDLHSNSQPVFTMLETVFGKNNVIDARPLSADLAGSRFRTSDGVHFTREGAAVLAQRLAGAVLKLNNVREKLTKLKPLGIGLGATLGIGLLGFGLLWISKRRDQLAGPREEKLAAQIATAEAEVKQLEQEYNDLIRRNPLAVHLPSGEQLLRAENKARKKLERLYERRDRLSLAGDDYQIQHRPSKGPRLHNLLEDDMLPPDVYDKPHYYTGYTEKAYLDETMRAIRAARGNPDALITVYRAAPKGVKTINEGDWITLSRSYAVGHSKHATDPKQDMKIYKARVPASSIRFAGDDLMEYGYWGEAVKTTLGMTKQERRHEIEEERTDPVVDVASRAIVPFLGAGVRYVPVKKIYVDPRKLAETITDVKEGRTSFSHGAPLEVSRLDSPRGAFYVMDGHHRLVELMQKGQTSVPIVISEKIPRIERTGGGYRDAIARKVLVTLDGVQPYDSETFSERVQEAKANPKLFKATADRVNEIAQRIAREGDAWGGRKVFISDIAKKLGVSTKSIAGPLLIANNRGWLVLERADLTAAMDHAKVLASEIESPMESRYHFVVIG